jgi:hypothetical protein
MVSLNTILAIGGLGAAYLIFKNLGGAAGIGSSIGQGFNVFGSNIAAGLNIGSEAIKNANKFDNPLNTSVPEGFRIDPTETRNYEDYINYKDDSPVDDSFVPFVFTPPTTAPPTVPVNFMDQFTFADRPISRPTTPAITYGPLPPFAGTLEYVVQQQYEGPQLPAYAGTLDYLYGNNV